MKTPCPHPNTMKLKKIFRHVCHVLRALTKAKCVFIELLKMTKNNGYLNKRNSSKKKLYSSIRLHYNWSSSHVLPMPEPDASHVYYDSTWNSIVPVEAVDDAETTLSGYLHWLEEKPLENPTVDDGIDEIDRLADLFIANCHEKFRLEKQESYRRYQEMLARSM